MSYITRGGSRTHYRASGEGPLIVLLHGFFGSHAEWKHFGYVDALKDRFMVATVDSLAHGESDKSDKPMRYSSRERAGDVVAVMDDLGHERAHVVGYSMGGWLAVGLAQHHPERLASLSIGGWNCIDGMGPGLLQGAGKARLTFDEYMAEARKYVSAGALDWVTGTAWVALSHCYDQLYELDGSAQSVADLGVPVLLYGGTEDAPHDPMKAFALEQGLQFLSIEGDHGSAMRHGASTLTPLLKQLAPAS